MKKLVKKLTDPENMPDPPPDPVTAVDIAALADRAAFADQKSLCGYLLGVAVWLDAHAVHDEEALLTMVFDEQAVKRAAELINESRRKQRNPL